MPRWLPTLDKRLDYFKEIGSNPAFRVMLSSDPSNMIPVGILERCVMAVVLLCYIWPNMPVECSTLCPYSVSGVLFPEDRSYTHVQDDVRASTLYGCSHFRGCLCHIQYVRA